MLDFRFIKKLKNNFDFYILLFLIFNALKIVLFSVFISSYVIDYKTSYKCFIISKFLISFVLTSFVCLSLLKLRFSKTFVLFYVVQFIYLLSHMCYFAYFNSYLHIFQIFQLFGEGTKALSNLSFFLDKRFLILFIDLPFFVLAVKHTPKSRNIIRITGFLTVFFVAVCCFRLFIPATKASIKDLNSPLSHIPNESIVVKKYGTIVNDVFLFYFYKNEENVIKHFDYGPVLQKSSGEKNNPNIVILQLESVDSNVINKEYKNKYITPFLHSLSKNCVYYPYTVSYHMGGGTSDAEFSILNSLEPLVSRPVMKLSSYNYPNSLIKQLKDYTCLAFHGNVSSYFNRDNAYCMMGFNNFYDITSMHLRNKGWGASDEDVLNFAKDKLAKIDKPFFSYIITMSSHASFTNARHYYNNEDYDDIKDTLVKNYFNSVSYVDATLENFVNFIKKNIPNTYIFIFGDHRPAINKPVYSDASLFFSSEHFEFVPLFILTPDNLVYEENSKVTCFLDLAPTILEACGVPYSIHSYGYNLLDFKKDNFPLIHFKGGLFSRNALYDKLINK